MANQAVKISLPPVSGWTLGTGLEAYGGGIIRLIGLPDKLNNSSKDGQWLNFADATPPTEGIDGLTCNASAGSEKAVGYKSNSTHLSGDFNIYILFDSYSATTGASAIADLVFIFVIDANNYFYMEYYRNINNGTYDYRGTSIVGGSSTNAVAASITASNNGLRLARTGTNWYMYYMANTGWVQVHTAGSVSTSAGYVRFYTANGASATNAVSCIFRNFTVVSGSSYPSGSPEAEMTSWLALPAGTLNGTTSLDIVENVLGGASTIKYQYATNNGAYNGSWVTKATMEAALRSTVITDTTNSLRIKMQFISNGSQAGEVAIASYVDETVTIPGVSDYPAESNVRFGVNFGSGGQTGSAYIPAATDVRSGVNVDATTGNLALPTEADVKYGTQFGANGTEYKGTLRAPVYDGTPFASVGASPQLFLGDAGSGILTPKNPRALAPAVALSPWGITPLAATNTDLIQCPSEEQYIISVTATNKSATPSAVRIFVVPYGEVLGDRHIVLYDVDCNQADPIVIKDITLTAGAKVVVYTANNTVTFSVNGIRNY